MSHKGFINLRVYAGVAKPNPKMGQSLGPHGINMMKFCEQFNKLTSHIRGDVPMKVRVQAFTDRTYKFIIKPPDTTWFLKRAAGKNKFTPFPGHVLGGYVKIQYAYEIAKIKKELDKDMKHIDLPLIMNCIMGTASSCGLAPEDTDDPTVPVPIKSKI